jgi:type III restriction enzyme
MIAHSGWTPAERALADELGVDTDRIEEVSSRLDLRWPNRVALETFLLEFGQHRRGDEERTPFECVLDSATGVGKTYILAAGIEYLAAADTIRNFAVIAPGATIRDKTVDNFTHGHPKSLLGPMQSQPVLITADNFNTAAVRASLDDDTQTKLYVFTVQSLTAPTTKQGRRTHDFQEGLGSGFYEHLASLDDLIVFADEHHCYWGPAFSEAVRGLKPLAIIGLTATPHPKTPEEQIIFRYPLAAAIADRWVKTPVIVGRRDDRSDPVTKLADGVNLLRYKEQAVDAWCAQRGVQPVSPVMLVVAQTIEEANEYAAILESSDFDGGRWAGTVLSVNSKLTGDKKEKALAELEGVEDPRSPIRIIISVGMLKEGWDVKNVYVIASMRASVSKVLTEQTLGRGMRLPFGKHTGIEMLDTLEVVAHERYSELLKRKDALNQQFIDHRTRAVLTRNDAGEAVVTTTTERVSAPVISTSSIAASAEEHHDAAAAAVSTRGAAVESTDERTQVLREEVNGLTSVLSATRADGMPTIEVPLLKTTSVKAQFSLTDIVDLDPFSKLGRSLAAEPDVELKREKVVAEIITSADGLRRTELRSVTADEQIEAAMIPLPLEDAREMLIDAVLGSPVVPTRPEEALPAHEIVNAMIDGMGDDAEHLLSAYHGRAASRLVRLIDDEYRRYTDTKPHFNWAIELKQLGEARTCTRRTSDDRTGPFSRQVAYNAWERSVYRLNWFDSAPERDVANIVDHASTVQCWLRLLTGDMPIVWENDSNYNPDLIVIEEDGTHWVVEVKRDKDVASDEVQAKRQAAKRWANKINALGQVAGTWRYLLVSETDIKDSKDTWSALKKLGA